MIDCPCPLSLSLLSCCRVEHRGELSAAAWRANDTRLYIYIYINWHPRNTPRIDSWNPWFSNSAPPTYLPSFSHSIFSLSIFISFFITQIAAYVASKARKFENLQKSNWTKVAYISKERSKEHSRASHARLFLCVYISLFLLLSFMSILSVRLRYNLFDDA